MAYRLADGPSGIEITITADTRNALFRDALQGALEAAYGRPPGGGSYSGKVVLVQALGPTLEALLLDLVRNALKVTRDADGTIEPPRWLAFDEGRAAVNLPLVAPRSEPRALVAESAERIDGVPEPFAVRLRLAPPASRS